MEENQVLDSRRKKLYFSLLIFQVITYAIQLVFAEMFRQKLGGIPELLMIAIQVLAGIMINVANVMFLRSFIKNTTVFIGVVTVVVLSFLLQTVCAAATSSPEYMTNDWYRVTQILIAIMNLSVLIFTFYVGTKDIFRTKHDLTYSLVGAANLFLLIGFIFAMIYLMMQFIFPGIFIPIEQTKELASIAVVRSAYILGNMDLPSEPHALIRNIMVMESICAHLYAVMIVGRLLSR